MSGPRSQPEAPRRVVEETRRLYANLLSRPLDTSQLARPTFKLIQDVVKNLITETRTLRQEFNASDFEQAMSKSVWDKRRRCDFLQRLIDFAANNKQPVVGCVASKLVVGLDPVKCNELLQALAKIAIARRQDSSKSTRTFTKASPTTGSQRAGASRATGGASSRHSSGSRRPSKDELSTDSRRESSRSSNQAEGAGSGSRKSPSSSTTRRHSPKAGQSEARADTELARRGSFQSDIQISNKHECSNEAAGKAALKATGLLQNDSDLSRNIQLLRSNLRAFQRVLNDVHHLEGQLRSRLQQGVVN